MICDIWYIIYNIIYYILYIIHYILYIIYYIFIYIISYSSGTPNRHSQALLSHCIAKPRALKGPVHPAKVTVWIDFHVDHWKTYLNCSIHWKPYGYIYICILIYIYITMYVCILIYIYILILLRVWFSHVFTKRTNPTEPSFLSSSFSSSSASSWSLSSPAQWPPKKDEKGKHWRSETSRNPDFPGRFKEHLRETICFPWKKERFSMVFC